MKVVIALTIFVLYWYFTHNFISQVVPMCVDQNSFWFSTYNLYTPMKTGKNLPNYVFAGIFYALVFVLFIPLLLQCFGGVLS